MSLILSRHATTRMRERGVSKEQVEQVLLNYHFSQPGNPDGQMYVGRCGQERDLCVCITADSDLQGRVIVKTVFWKGETAR